MASRCHFSGPPIRVRVEVRVRVRVRVRVKGSR